MKLTLMNVIPQHWLPTAGIKLIKHVQFKGRQLNMDGMIERLGSLKSRLKYMREVRLYLRGQKPGKGSSAFTHNAP